MFDKLREMWDLYVSTLRLRATKLKSEIKQYKKEHEKENKK